MNEPEIKGGNGKPVTVDQSSRRYSLQLGMYSGEPGDRLICSFFDHQDDMHAAVISPVDDISLLTQRVVSFLRAYLKVHDVSQLTQELRSHISYMPDVSASRYST